MSSPDLFLGIDLGTTSVKATLINGDWAVIGQRRIEYNTIQVKPVWIEQNPLDWWKAACKAVKELLLLTRVESGNIAAISVSSQAPTLLGVDRDGNPTGNAIIWMDRRSSVECKEVLNTMRDTITAISGNRIDPYYMLPKLIWEINNYKEKYNATYQYLQANGWVIYKLTGKFSIDITHAALTQLFNIYKNSWEINLMKELSIDVNKLPQVFECTKIIGTVSSEAAKIIGVKSGIPVIAGAIDGAAAPLGLKLYRDKQAFEMSGQSSGIGIVIDKPIFHPNLCLLKHAVKGKWILKGSMSTSGGSLRWFRDNVDDKPNDSSAYSKYEEMVEKVPPGSNGLIFLPYLAGERAPLWDSNVRGLFFGLHLKTSKSDMVRAIMEGTAFGLKSILEELYKVGLEVEELFGTGGGYLSTQWSQIKSDILGIRIKAGVGDADTASLGSAYLALMAATGAQVSEIPEIKIKKIYTPDISNRNLYKDYYKIFKKLYTINRELFENLSLAG